MSRKLIGFYLTILLFVFIVMPQTVKWHLVWDKNTEDDMHHYIVYRDTNPSPTDSIASVIHVFDSVDTVEYVDTNITRGVLYYYRLIAVNTAGAKSDFSDEVFASIPKIIDSTFTIYTGILNPIKNSEIFVDPDQSSGHILESSNENHVIVTFSHDTVFVQADPIDYVGEGEFQLTVTDNDQFFDASGVSASVNLRILPTPSGMGVSKD